MKEQEKAFQVFINTFYKQRRDFTLKEVRDTLLREAGTTRIAPNRTIDDWIKSAVWRGVLKEVYPYKYSWRLVQNE